MNARRSLKRHGFTLLEVMLSVAIVAIALGAVFSAEAGSVKMAQRARKLGFAALLSRCKMGEIEEDLAKKGLPTIYQSESDQCCKDAPIDGFHCKWEIVPIVMPESMFNGEDEDSKDGKGKSGSGSKTDGSGNASDSKSSGPSGLLGAASAALGLGKKDTDDKSKDPKDKDAKDKDAKDKDPSSLLSGDPSQFLAGSQENGGQGVDSMTAMAMQFVYPVLKPAFQAQIRRASVKVMWSEGSADKEFELNQYVVAEQAVPLATDPNNPNALLGASPTGSLTGPGTSPASSTIK